MPNLNPVPDSTESLKLETNIIERDARVKVYPYGSITMGEKGEGLSAMEEIAGRLWPSQTMAGEYSRRSLCAAQ
jgi:dihydroorotase-like cyclic amidohydrolase